MNKYLTEVSRLAKRYGYTAVQGSKHIKLAAEGKPSFSAASTPKNRSVALKNIEDDLRKGGKQYEPE